MRAAAVRSQAPQRMRCAAAARARLRGFGMLEAIVALALLALVGGSLFAWINTSLDAAARLRERDAVQPLARLAAAWAQTRDPMREPRGEAELAPGVRVRWDARATTPPTAVAPLPGGTATPFRVALYEVDVTVRADDGREVSLTLTRIGSERDASQLPVLADD